METCVIFALVSILGQKPERGWQLGLHLTYLNWSVQYVDFVINFKEQTETKAIVNSLFTMTKTPEYYLLW